MVTGEIKYFETFSQGELVNTTNDCDLAVLDLSTIPSFPFLIF